MLPKINRIRKKKDFEIIFKNSKCLRNSLFILRIAKNSLNLTRFGFVVSLKVSKKATVRNKIKRRLSEAAKMYQGEIKNGADIVFIALPEMTRRNFLEIKEAVGAALAELKIALKK